MICPKCGRRTYKDEAICPKCGADMTARRSAPVSTARVQVKKIEPVTQSQSTYTPVQPQPAAEPVYIPQPAPTPEPEPIYTPAPNPEPEPEPVQEKEDLDRTLTFAAIKEASAVESAAVREYNRMKAQLRENKSNDDGSKVVLERLPEGYVYVKMSIDDADRLNKRKEIPKPLIIAVAGAAVITVFLIVLLIVITGGSSAPLIVGKWQGEIEPSRFGISGIPFTSIDTVWEFEKDGDITITPQDALLSGYELTGTYKLSDDNNTVELELDYNGEKLKFELTYNVDKESDILTISNSESPSHTYSLEKQK